MNFLYFLPPHVISHSPGFLFLSAYVFVWGIHWLSMLSISADGILCIHLISSNWFSPNTEGFQEHREFNYVSSWRKNCSNLQCCIPLAFFPIAFFPIAGFVSNILLLQFLLRLHKVFNLSDKFEYHKYYCWLRHFTSIFLQFYYTPLLLWPIQVCSFVHFMYTYISRTWNMQETLSLKSHQIHVWLSSSGLSGVNISLLFSLLLKECNSFCLSHEVHGVYRANYLHLFSQEDKHILCKSSGWSVVFLISAAFAIGKKIREVIEAEVPCLK